MDTTLVVILCYVIAQLAIGAFISRRIKTEEDYLIAGRKLGYGLTTFTIFATWFGAETCIGAAGAIYSDGLSGGSADPFGYAMCIFLMGLFLAVPLWKMRLTTLGDLFRIRYSASVERLAVVLLIPGSMLWAAAQIRAFGQVLSASSGVEVSITITVAAIIVILYTLFGGLLADAWTDVIQGIALIIGLIVIFVTVFANNGPELLASVPRERLNLFGGEGVSILDTFEAWSIPILGSVIAAELITRAIAARSPEVAQRSAMAAGTIYLAMGMIPVFIGLVGVVLMPDLQDPEQLLPLVAQQYLPGFIYALFAGALVSAILSTVDSSLLVSASLLSHNVILPLRGPMSEEKKVRVARLCVLAFGVLAYILALHAEGVYALVEEASAFGSAGLVIVIVFAVFTRHGNPLAAHATLIAGVVAWILGAYILEIDHPYLVSLLVSLVAYLITTSFFTSASPVA